MSTKYHIYLAGKYLGYTYFESADPSMGVVMGKIYFEDIKSPYSLVRDYCRENGVLLNEDDSELEAISTQSIDALRVVSEKGVEIKGLGSTILGFREDGYEIDVFGIPYPFYGEEFPGHREDYENKFR